MVRHTKMADIFLILSSASAEIHTFSLTKFVRLLTDIFRFLAASIEMWVSSMHFMAIIYIIAGIFHFIRPAYYLPIMPRYLPYHLELIYLSGVVEIVCGILLLFEQTRVLGAWLTIALLIAVCKFERPIGAEHSVNFIPFAADPANIQMAQDFWAQKQAQKYLALARLPLQFVLIHWAYQYTKTPAHVKHH